LDVVGENGEGASPRARGNRRPAAPRVVTDGCIPARAGKPSSGRSTACSRWVHPRARGETTAPSIAQVDEWGASPRARGNLVLLSLTAQSLGCIPARAGKPALVVPLHHLERVHPRARGETMFDSNLEPMIQGASPRARGNHRLSDWNPRRPGCIPARAGKPLCLKKKLTPARVHPRARGETWSGPNDKRIRWGASPRARGNHRGPRAGRSE